MSSIHKSGSSTGDREPIPAAVGAALLANQSHLNGADVSGAPKGLVRDDSLVCAASQTGCIEICGVPGFQGKWAETAAVIIAAAVATAAIICSGVFARVLPRQNHNTLRPSELRGTQACVSTKRSLLHDVSLRDRKASR